MSEFSLIKDYFYQKIIHPSVILPSGDDAAVIEIPPGEQLVVSMDTMVEGQHFLPNSSATDIAYKAVMSSVSDLAAMGASPKWLTGSLTLPEADKTWLSDFSHGLFEAMDLLQLLLIGGDITRGPLNITFQVQGTVAAGTAITRSGAQLGDLIYITNTVGDAGLGLQVALGNIEIDNPEAVLKQYHRPQAQVSAGLMMQAYANSCIDISDGLLQDLQHVLTASGVGAEIYAENIPLSKTLQQLDFATAMKLALTAGDDYQLLMTIPKQQQTAFEQNMPVPVTLIGSITEDRNLRVLDNSGAEFNIDQHGFQHF